MAIHRCPGCQGEFQLLDEHVGTAVACPHCGQVIQTARPVAPSPVAPRPVAPSPVPLSPAPPRPVPPPAGAPKPVAPKPVPPKPVTPKPVAPKPVAPKPVPPKPVAPKPVERAPTPAPIRPAASRRGTPRPSEEKARSRAPLYLGIGAVAVVLVAVLAVVLSRGGAPSNPSPEVPPSANAPALPDVAMPGHATPETPATTPAPPEPARPTPQAQVTRLAKAFATKPPKSSHAFQTLIEELTSLGEPAEDLLGAVSRAYFEGPGAQDQVLRRRLGYLEFAHRVPDGGYRG